MKLLFIVPYFGKFNSYFQLFLNSIATSDLCDLLIVTDDKSKYDYPQNVTIRYTSFEEFRNEVQRKMDFKITLDTPYKLCDFKPTYGYLFEDELLNYQYWGYCDLDIIFGDLDGFLHPILNKGFDKIFELGHCTIIKNESRINRMFLSTVNGVKIGQKALSSSKIEVFDEAYVNSINNIFIENNCNNFLYSLGADID
ncbi:DUF6625 family protein, partial [Streptococcus agalactiae]